MKIKTFLRKTIYKRVAVYLLVFGMVMSDVSLEALAAGNADAPAAESYADVLNMSETPENAEPDSGAYSAGTMDGGADGIMLLSDDDIASGTYENIAWRIDSEGKLTVEGEGEFADRYGEDNSTEGRAPWYSARRSIKTAQIKVTGMKDASYMFFECINLIDVDFSEFDTSNVTDMRSMFSGCSSLTSLDFSEFDTGNVTDMAWMFWDCSSLTRLDLSGFDMRNVEEAESMLEGGKGYSLAVLYTPYRIKEGMSIYLPKGSGEWHDSLDNNYWILPEGLDDSILLTWGEEKEPVQTKLTVKSLKKKYIQNSTIEKEDLLVRYRDEEGTTRIIADGYEVSVDMSTLGEKTLTISYLGLTATTKLEVIENILIAQGTYNDIRWEINATGKLTVEGTGEFAASSGNDGYSAHRAPWYDMRDAIVTAQIKVKGMQNASYMFCGCKNLTDVDVSEFDTSNVTNMGAMFGDCNMLENLDVSRFDTSNVTNMGAMFSGCNMLENLDVSGFDTSKVTSMASMFFKCNMLENLDVSRFDTSNVTNMTFMFSDCNMLENVDVSGFDTSKVTNMRSAFTNCRKLENLDVSKFDTSKVTDMRFMFSGCEALQRLDVGNFDTSNSTNMDAMFQSCNSLTNLDVSSFDTSKVTDMGYMFGNCYNLATLDVSGFDTSKVLKMDYMFGNCFNLTTLDVNGFDTSNVTNMRAMFTGCSLTSLDLSGFDMSNVINADDEMFCRTLTRLYTPRGVKTDMSIDISGGSKWYDASGTEYTALPTGLDHSILLTKDETPDIVQEELIVNLIKKTYEQGSEINSKDLIVKYRATDGRTDILPLKGTDGADNGYTLSAVDMNTFGEKTVTVSYKNGTAVLSKEVCFTVVEKGATKPDPVQPDPVQEELLVTLLKKTYELGSKIEPKDLTVQYRGSDGKLVVLSPKEADGDGYTLSAVNMNILGEKKVTVSYNNGTKVLSKEVSFTVVEKSTEPTKPGEEGSHSGSDRPGEGGSHSGSDKPGEGGSHSGSDKPDEGEDSGEGSGEEGSHEGSDTPAKAAGLHVTFPEGKVFPYTGGSIIPKIVVTNNEETLTEGVDYTVKCSNNTKAGTAKLTVTGKGRFTGKQVAEFTITRKSLKDPDIAVGSLIVAENSKAVPIIYYNGMKLGSKDYTLEGDTGKLALGAASPSIKVTGKGNYMDEITIKIKVVAKSDLKKFGVTLGKEKLVYNGKPQQPTINITDKSNPEKKFTEGTDYKLVFNNSHTNAGTVKVTVIGLGEYSGAVTKSYKIQPRKAGDADVTVTGLKQSYTYTSAGVTFNASAGKLTVKFADSASGMKADLVEGKDYKISYSANKKAGTAKYTINFLGNYKGSKAKKGTFTIAPATLNDSTVSVVVPDKIYTGKKNAYKSVPIVVDKAGNVLKKSDYTVNYYSDSALTKEIKGKDNLIELGDSQKEAAVYVKITGKGNYAGNTGAFAKGAYQVKRTGENVFDLSKAKVTFKQGGNAVKKLEYTGLPVEPEVTVTVKVKGAGDITLDPSQYDITWAGNINKGKATAVITGNGTQVKGYAFVGSKNATISIGAKNIGNVKDLFGEAVSKTLNGMFARPQPALNTF